jgi:circadian clock protein KaiB
MNEPEVLTVSSNPPPGRVRDEKRKTPPGALEMLYLRLYIAGRGPNSVRAIANLDALAQAYGRGCFEIEIVDVLVEPQRALQDHVLVTPTLVKLAPPPTVQIAGDLSQAYRVVYALGLDPGISPRCDE